MSLDSMSTANSEPIELKNEAKPPSIRSDNDNNDDDDDNNDNEKHKFEDNSGMDQSEPNLITQLEPAGRIDPESESSSDSEDDEDEDIPIFAYKRVQFLPKKFFSNELISAISINENLLAFGTSSGLIHLVDPVNSEALGTLRARKSPILAFSYDQTSNHLLAASMDGTVIIATVDHENKSVTNSAFDLKTSVYSAVLLSNYKETKSFIYSTKSGKVVLNYANWLGHRLEKVIYEGADPIVKLELIKSVLVWMSDEGVIFWDVLGGKQVYKIDKPRGKDLPMELVWPRFCFPENDRIIIAWFDHIWNIKVENSTINSIESSNFKLSSAMSSFSKPANEISVTLEHEFSLQKEEEEEDDDDEKDGNIVVGIANFKDDLILLTINKIARNSSPPELRIMNSITHEEVLTEGVHLKGFGQLRCNDFHLGQHIDRLSTFYIVCSTDGIIAKEIDLQGKYDWYLSKKDYVNAWEISQHLISRKERCQVGIKQVEKFLNDYEDEDKDEEEDDDNDNKDPDYQWELAASFLKKVLDAYELNDEFKTEKWEQWSWIFIHSKHIKILAKILPQDFDGSVSVKVYDHCLEWFLLNDELKFFEYLNLWSVKNGDDNVLFLFDNIKIANHMEKQLKLDPQRELIERCLANLYLSSNNPKMAITHLINLKDPEVVMSIENFGLIHEFVDQLPDIFKILISQEEFANALPSFVEEKASPLIEILVKHRHELQTSKIVTILDAENLQMITFFYLRKLSLVDSLLIQDYQTELLTLYAQYQPSSLLSFLKKHNNYDINRALQVTNDNGLYQELVYLLGTIGKTHEAMNLIIEKLDDPEYGIEFAQEYSKQNKDSKQDSNELWEILITNGIRKPNFIKAFLKYTGTLFDSSVLKRIPEKVEIEGLKDSLQRIMNENELIKEIHKLILKIIEVEGENKFKNLEILKWKGNVVEMEDWNLQNGVVVKRG